MKVGNFCDIISKKQLKEMVQLLDTYEKNIMSDIITSFCWSKGHLFLCNSPLAIIDIHIWFKEI